jgi:hypothetical protein
LLVLASWYQTIFQIVSKKMYYMYILGAFKKYIYVILNVVETHGGTKRQLHCQRLCVPSIHHIESTPPPKICFSASRHHVARSSKGGSGNGRLLDVFDRQNPSRPKMPFHDAPPLMNINGLVPMVP